MKKNVIDIPAGHEASFDKDSGVVTISPKSVGPVMERIKTVADLLAEHGYTEDSFDLACRDLDPDEKAYRIIKMLAKTLNEGWIPNWDNSNEYKYFPGFYMDGGSSGFRFYVVGFWGSGSGVGSRLCFKSSELARHAGTNFISVYKQFMVI